MWHHQAMSGHYAHHGNLLVHTVVSAVIHGVVYGLIFKLFRTLSLQEDFLIGGVAIVVIVFLYWFFSRNR
jgi:hypothetical protein